MENVKITALIDKDGPMIYISHLDFIRFIYRALRRADLPFVLSQGFSPRPKIKFGQALKLGQSGNMRIEFFLKERIDEDDFKKRMEKQLIKGLRIIKIEYEK
ncbi:MAG: DUF2344 domain-containing protein [Candidatus Omnitrophica bacterium]|nr:DUF2344 domain-containing protein [Candidatus Omnitrophota bacterium]